MPNKLIDLALIALTVQSKGSLQGCGNWGGDSKASIATRSSGPVPLQSPYTQGHVQHLDLRSTFRPVLGIRPWESTGNRGEERVFI